jgi:diguanylate cyclase (GGDEF)-like protein
MLKSLQVTCDWQSNAIWLFYMHSTNHRTGIWDIDMSDNQVKVLLVEDNQEYVWMLRLILEKTKSTSFEITHVEQLQEALRQADEYIFDIILLDLTLPDSQGYNTFCEMYSQAPHIPIVVMTALDDKALALRAVREGAQDYLVKGDVDVNQLVRAIQFALERHQTLENLRRLSLVDELTGILNRRGFLSLAVQHINIAQRAKRELILFFADLDGLKQINDQFGHNEGDNALKRTASILKQTLRSSDLIARMGGDEFTILAIDAPQHNADTILTRLRYNLQKINDTNTQYQLSLSIGVAQFDPQNNSIDINKMLARADKALYEEKRNRNRIPVDL